jgi:L-threonylcarbamoyladenylate synthase
MSPAEYLSISKAVRCLRDGAVIAYPTEAVYGLGCDPANEAAVEKILQMKNRPASAGMILIADRFDFFEPFIEPVSSELMERAMSTWPGPVTWLFPRADGVPDWLAGTHPTVAIRLTAHPVCRELSSAFNGAIVSTSANPSTAEPARNAAQVDTWFGDALCGIVEGELGAGERPSEIRHLADGRVIRGG